MKAGPRALAELPSMLDGHRRRATSRSSSRCRSSSQALAVDRAARPRRMQWLNAHHELNPVTRHAPGRARVDRCHRPRLRHVRVRPARRRDGHVRLPGVQRDRRRRGVALGRGDGRHDRARRRRLGRPRRPRRHRPDRAAGSSAGLLDNILASQYALGLAPSSGRSRPPVGAASSAPTAASRPAHERAFYCPKCGMRLLRG